MGSDLPYTPHINGSRVFPEREKQLRWAIPSGHDQGCVFSFCFASALSRLRRGFIEGSCKPKVGDLEDPTITDEKIGSYPIDKF